MMGIVAGSDVVVVMIGRIGLYAAGGVEVGFPAL